ncbi:MAG: hypothetical protein PHH98_02230 [Candidatus Gracilibacteria bacterium]|nr:hypothetical protein [Candidatus Gracilibacteria bacterium]
MEKHQLNSEFNLTIEGAKDEVCKNENDVLKSKTTIRIINILNNDIQSIYLKILGNKIISNTEYDYILSFFNDENTLVNSQNIISKLFLLQGNENSEFIDSFLKDENGKISVVKVIEYIKNLIFNYKLKIDTDNPKSIKKIRTDSKGDYYKYTNNGENQLFIVSEGNIFLFQNCDKNTTLLDNGLIFTIEKNSDNTQHISTDGGVLYEFNGTGFIEVLKTPGLCGISNTNAKRLYNVSDIGISIGLSKINKDVDGKYSIEEILEIKYSNIEHKKGLIIARNYSTNKIEIYKEFDGVYQIIYKTTTYSDTFEINELGYGYFEIENNGLTSILKLNNDNILDIFDENLIDTIGINTYLLINCGLPTLIKNKNGKGIYIFDIETGIVKKLVDIGNIETELPTMILDKISIETENGTIVLYYKNGILFKFKKGYKIRNLYNPYSIQKGFFGNQIIITNDFETMENYLEEVKIPYKLER